MRRDLDCVLLCLIRMHKDVSGYQLRMFIEESTGYLYRAHLSQIYPALKRLHDEGLVTCFTEERAGKPDLKLYNITDEGVAVCEEWLTTPIELESTRESVTRQLMRLVLMGHLKPEQTIDYIDTCIEAISEGRAQHMQNDMEREASFFSDLEPEVRERYKILWKHKDDLVLEKYDLQLEHLRRLREQLA